MSHQRVMLVRARPGTSEARRALETAAGWAVEQAPSLVFFHGPGLIHAAGAGACGFSTLGRRGLDLRVCRAGWRRLSGDSVPEPFTVGSLVQFWAAALGALEVRSFGAERDD
ncbi:MAG: hypothetical protein ACOCVP_07400 [Wenzhouxiangella sp.]